MALSLAFVLALLDGSCGAMEFAPSEYQFHKPKNKSIVEARVGYLWSTNEINLRMGDSEFVLPSKRKLYLDGPFLGLQVGTFALTDLAVRAQLWTNIPLQSRANFLFQDISRVTDMQAWDTRAWLLEADLSAIYHLNLGPMPYSAGLMGGYRFYLGQYHSKRVRSRADHFDDNYRIHVPYVGLYYAHTELLKSLVRLELAISPITFTQLDSTKEFSSSGDRIRPTISGSAVFGQWFDSLFEVSKPIGDQAFLGGFLKFTYINTSGSARVDIQDRTTNFSMDLRHLLFSAGLTGTYTF